MLYEKTHPTHAFVYKRRDGSLVLFVYMDADKWVFALPR